MNNYAQSSREEFENSLGFIVTGLIYLNNTKSFIGTSEHWLPYSTVGNLSATCRPTLFAFFFQTGDKLGTIEYRNCLYIQYSTHTK